MKGRICFDNRWQGRHGIGRFAAEIARRIPELVLVDGGLKPSNPFDVLYLTVRLLLTPCKIWFSPGYNAPILGLSRYIFTIHDLNHIDIPANSNWLKRLYYRLVMRPACRKAARVLTISEYSRRRIIDWAGVAPTQVVNVGCGVSDSFKPDVPPYNPGFPYLLCVGNRKAHKNEARLLRAFAQAAIPQEIRLVFSGPPNEELPQLAKKLGIKDRIVFMGMVDEERVPSVYRGARALVFPSLYEGFGLPVVEAMACGIPVLTSNVTSLPEIAGDAALLVDPLNEAEIARGIEHIVSDDALRAKLVTLGFERFKSYSWDQVAARVRAVLNDDREERRRR